MTLYDITGASTQSSMCNVSTKLEFLSKTYHTMGHNRNQQCFTTSTTRNFQVVKSSHQMWMANIHFLFQKDAPLTAKQFERNSHRQTIIIKTILSERATGHQYHSSLNYSGPTFCIWCT